MAVSYLNLVNDDGSNLVGSLVDAAELQLLLRGSFVTSTSTGAVNNWAPPIDGHTFINWNGAADATFSGLAGGAAGLTSFVRNITATKVAYFLHQSGLSSAGNKYTNTATSVATPVGPGGWIAHRHDGTDWQLVGREQGGWIAYTPTWVGSITNPVIGNGVILGRYRISGRTVQVDVHLVPGSTTTYGSGTYTHSLPVAAADINGQTGAVFLYHAGAAYSGAVLMSSTTAFSVWAAGGGQMSPTVPFTFANADQLRVALTYITT